MRGAAFLLLLTTAPLARAQGEPAIVPAPAPAPAPAAKSTIAVLPLRADALQLNEVKRLNFLLRQRAATRGGFEVQSEETTTALVEASQSLGVDCDLNAADCGTQIGRIADVERVLLGRATGGLGGAEGAPAAVGLDVSLVDVQRGVEVKRVSALVPAEPSLQTAAVNELADLLYGDGGLVALDVVAEPAGADILVNGARRGIAPLPAPVDALAPGEHHVRITKKGFLPFDARVPVQRGEAARLEVRLEPDPEGVRTENSTLAVAVPFVIAGAGVLLAAGGGVLAAVGLDPWFRYAEAKATIDGAKPGDKGYVATVTEQWRLADTAATEWETWGQGVSVAGFSLLGVGSAALVGGAVVGVVLLTSDGDADAPPAE